MLPGRRTSATAVADGQVIEWSPPSTIGIAPGRGHLVDLAVDQGVGALDPGRDDVRVARIDDVRISNGSTPSWSEWIEPDVYCASRIARGPNRAPGRWLTASSNGAPTIATSTLAPAQLAPGP